MGRQRLPFEQLHHDHRLVIMFLNLINRTDIGVIQRGCRARFALKPAKRVGITDDFIRQKFKRHEAAQTDVLGLVNHSHSARAQLLDDAVMRDGLPDKAC